MMKLEDITEKKIELNNQEIFILKKSELKNIHDIKIIEEFENMSEFIAGDFKSHIKYVLEKDNLIFTVYNFQINKGKYIWGYYFLHEYYGDLYRIQIENYQCNRCNNVYSVGNAAIPDLFMTIDRSEYTNTMNRAEKLPKAKCPYCGEVISRYFVIWADVKKQNE